MPKLLILIFMFLVQKAFSQAKDTPRCKIEIFLLKRNIPSFDTTYKLMGRFDVLKEDLQDTAFIKDEEIVSYTIEKFKINNGQRKYKKEDHIIRLSNSISDRAKALGNISLCCGRQYALVVDGEIIYGGYFWNHVSSFVAVAPISYINEDEVSFRFMYVHREKDPRKNPALLSCLKSSGRLILKKLQRINSK